jgi:hypothetical protein
MERAWDWVEQITGPAMLKAALGSWNATGQAPITVLRPELIFPIDWRMSSSDWSWDASMRGKPRRALCIPHALPCLIKPPPLHNL